MLVLLVTSVVEPPGPTMATVYETLAVVGCPGVRRDQLIVPPAQANGPRVLPEPEFVSAAEVTLSWAEGTVSVEAAIAGAAVVSTSTGAAHAPAFSRVRRSTDLRAVSLIGDSMVTRTPRTWGDAVDTRMRGPVAQKKERYRSLDVAPANRRSQANSDTSVNPGFSLSAH